MASIKINGDTSGYVQVSAPAVAGTSTLTLPATTGTVAVTNGNTWTGTQNFSGATMTGAGLDLITTQSFSAVSSVSINNCFTATYDNYVFTADVTSSADTYLVMRLRANGSDDTNTSYKRWLGYGSSAPAFATLESNNASTVFSLSSSVEHSAVVNVFAPRLSQKTRVIHNVAFHVTNAGLMFGGGVFNATTSFDGFTLFPNSGTITGTVSVYGYRKS